MSLRGLGTFSPIDERDTVAWRLVEADLISSTVALAELAYGKVRPAYYTDEPAAILERLFSLVDYRDLTILGGAVWLRAQRSFRKFGRISWDDLTSSNRESHNVVAFYRKHGVGVGLQAEESARRLLAVRAALNEVSDSRKRMADAYAKAHEAVRGVVGVD